uniref:NELL2-like EGF domain-containing protein n=1 Tax=Physcomitrium patens TaxID=3218 RepID=A0A7I4D281_PHYPA
MGSEDTSPPDCADSVRSLTVPSRRSTKTGRALCDINAFCIDTATSYYCNCKRGYTGDGRYGEGHTGCVKHRFSKWQVVTSIVGSILGALLILYCCIACIRGSLRARSRSAMEQQGGPAYGYPAQPYPPQQGIPMYPTNKVPPPAGVV